MTAVRRAEGLLPALVLVGVLVLLHQLGTGPLALPADRSPGGLERWAVERDAPTTAMAALRVAALALAWQQVAALVIGLVGRLLRLPGVVRAAEPWTLPALRRSAGGVAGVGLAASVLLGAVPAGAEPGPTTVTLQVVDEPAPSGDQVTLEVEAEPAPAPAPTPPPRPTPSPAPATAAPGPWTVAPGDHLWAIAEATVGEDGDVAGYWQALVAANPQLADPDLVFPGEVISRPPLA